MDDIHYRLLTDNINIYRIHCNTLCGVLVRARFIKCSDKNCIVDCAACILLAFAEKAEAE